MDHSTRRPILTIWDGESTNVPLLFFHAAQRLVRWIAISGGGDNVVRPTGISKAGRGGRCVRACRPPRRVGGGPRTQSARVGGRAGGRPAARPALPSRLHRRHNPAHAHHTHYTYIQHRYTHNTQPRVYTLDQCFSTFFASRPKMSDCNLSATPAS